MSETTRPGPAIVILGRDWCEDTIRLRAWLDAHAIAYVYRNVELDPAADIEIRARNGGLVRTPTILLGEGPSPARVLVEPSDDELARAIAEIAERTAG